MTKRYHLFILPMIAVHGDYVKYDDLVKSEKQKEIISQELSEAYTELRFERQENDSLREDRTALWKSEAKLEYWKDFWIKMTTLFASISALLAILLMVHP